MYIPRGRWVFIAALTLFPSCLAQTSSKVLCTASVTDSIPSCALQCVQSFIKTDYPTNTCACQDVDCLCRTNTTSGYTLGEAALRCNVSFCSTNSTEESAVYDICDSVSGALPKTHATILVTVMSAKTSTAMARQKEAPSSSVTTSPSSTNSRPGITSGSRSTTSSSFRPSLLITSTASTTSQQPTPYSTNSTNSSLNPAAVIGVSVASGVSGFFILGVIIFCCCRKIRRRHKKGKDRDFFEIGGVMSEPPDFNLPPPRRSTLGPNHLASEASRSSETGISMPLSHDNKLKHINSPGRPGLAISSHSISEASQSQSSPRTVSDLLPDKPEIGIYPEPLNWSNQRLERPVSSVTLFEEDEIGQRSLLGTSTQYTNFSGPIARYAGDRPRNLKPVTGLPSNPSAMLHGFGETQNGTFTKKNVDCRVKPGSGNSRERIPHSHQAGGFHHLPNQLSQGQIQGQEDIVGAYWRNPNTGYAREPNLPSSRGVVRQSSHNPQMNGFSGDPGAGFVTSNENRRLRRKSRYSGDFKLLSPVREVKTAADDAQKPDGKNYLNGNVTAPYPTMSFAAPLNPTQEIVSRPRVVRRDDIKRVQISRGKPQPKELKIPYSPGDYWLGHRGSKTGLLDLDLSARRPPVENMTAQMPQRKPAPLEQKRRPSITGSDFIIHVE